MASFLIDSVRGGFAEFEDKGIRGAFKRGQALDIRKKIDSLTCQQALTDEFTHANMTALAICIIPSSNGKSYAFCTDGKIFERSALGVWNTTPVYTETDGVIKGASEAYDAYGNTFLYWATDTEVHRKRIIGTGYTDSGWSDVDASLVTGNGTTSGDPWPKTNLTSADWHTMRWGVGNLHIANASTLAMVGYDNSYTNNSLDLIFLNVAKTIIERGIDVIVGVSSKAESKQGGLFQWDTVSQNYIKKKYVPADGVNALIDTELPLMQAGEYGDIYYADMNSVLPVIRIAGGGKCNPDGVTDDSGLALFGIFGNDNGYDGIYSYGRRMKNHDFVLNFDYPLTCDEIGAVSKVGEDIIISYKSGSNYRIAKVDTTTKATAYYESIDLKAPPKHPTRQPVWERIKLKMAPLPAGTIVEVYYRLNKSGSFSTKQARLADGSTQLTTDSATEAFFFIQEKAEIFEYQIKLIPSVNATPEIYSHEVFFN